MPRVAALILAAGGSTRMGSPKQLLPIGDHSLIRHVVDVAISAGCSPIRVVLGAESETIIKQLEIPNVEILLNPDWSHGIGTSIRAGMAHLPPTIDAILILLCDQPLITPDHLRALIAAHKQQKKPLCACLYPDGSAGPPALFAKSYFPKLLALPDDAGAKRILAQNPTDLATIPIPEAAIDLDTPQDYQRFQSLNDPMTR
jgi:molybdenum cofactor cytidylyltransferase